METKHNGWHTDLPPSASTKYVTCLQCGRGDLRWVFSAPKDKWSLFELWPWFAGSRITPHGCRDAVDE